jgi:serine/threonine protein kinase
MEDEEEEVAIKCFRPIDSINQTRDFLREVRVMKALNHENIVKIYDFHEDMMLIIMEYMSGGSLQEFVAMHRHELKVDDILLFAIHIAKVSARKLFISKLRVINDLIFRECIIWSKIRLCTVIWQLVMF